MPEKTTFRDSALRAVAIIGLVAILILGAWGIIQLVVGLPDFFASFGSAPSQTTSSNTAEKVALTAPATVPSGQPFPLSWTHQGGGNYSYTFSYSCATDLSFAALTPAGQYQQVPCNTPFNYTNAMSNVNLVAVLPTDATKQVATTITVSAVRLADSKVVATSSATINVLPAKSAQTTSSQGSSSSQSAASAPKPTSAYTPSGRTSNLYGSPDLAVQIISATPTANGRYSVQFQVSNVGTNVAPYGWEFTAALPLNPPYTFVSASQQKLYPGHRIVYTLAFDAPNANAYTPYNNYAYGYTNYNYYGYGSYPYYGNNFSVTVDPQNLVGDYNRTNNTASVSVY